jgi:hypothetical protein
MGEISFRKIASLKVSSRQAGESQERATHGGRTEVYRASIDGSKLTLAQTESGMVQIRILGRVFVTPSVPCSRTAAQNLNVRTLGQLTTTERYDTLRAETIRHCALRYDPKTINRNGKFAIVIFLHLCVITPVKHPFS